MCAEDPDAGFLPAPGRIARFDPALGPRVRIDTGVTAGSTVPAAFDSLIAKVIATGDTREEARSRLFCALTDFDLVIEGGATNKGFLLDVLTSDDYRRGGVDTEWLDRFVASGRAEPGFAVEALIAAGILSYQAARQTARLNFFADPTNISPARVPPSMGQQIDLSYGGEPYRLMVYTVGSWRYRVHLDGRVVTARAARGGPAHGAPARSATARCACSTTPPSRACASRSRATRTSSRARPPARCARGRRRWWWRSTCSPGDRVEVGQALGVLEAMKMEISFAAPVAGVVTGGARAARAAGRRRRGAAGDRSGLGRPVATLGRRAGCASPRCPIRSSRSSRPAKTASSARPIWRAPTPPRPTARSEALEAVRDEVLHVFLGYDVNPERDRAPGLAAPRAAPGGALARSCAASWPEIRRELCAFADVEQLLIRSPRASVSGDLGPSNDARLRMFVRRLRASGAGIGEEFLDAGARRARALRHHEPRAQRRARARGAAPARLPALRRGAAPAR